jgi:hypothetical protein
MSMITTARPFATANPGLCAAGQSSITPLGIPRLEPAQARGRAAGDNEGRSATPTTEGTTR